MKGVWVLPIVFSILVLGASLFLPHAYALFWSPILSGTTENLFSIDFVDVNTGYATGQNIILKTTDGGTTWTTSSSGFIAQLRSVDFVDANTGFAVGNVLMKTTDGGATWSFDQFTLSGFHVWSLDFVDANNGYVVGGTTGNGLFGKTTDGGATWSGPTTIAANRLFSVQFTDANNGIAVGDGGIIVTTSDGGATWTLQASGTGNTLVNIDRAGASHWVAVGSSGTVLTSPAGVVWTPQSSGTTETLTHVHMLDANTGYAVGDNGIILKTSDGGVTWSPESSTTTEALNSVAFADANTGIAVGNSGEIQKSSLLDPCGGSTADADGDGICDGADACPNDPNNDVDGDAVCGDVDNCPTFSNPDQADANNDGQGDICDPDPGDRDNDGDGVPNSLDVCHGHDDNQDADGDGIPDGCDTLRISRASPIPVVEGHTGTTSITFTVTLRSPSTLITTVDVTTRDGTARVDDNDYIAKSETLTFLPGEISKTFTVQVVGDTKRESDEYFFADLSNPVNVSIQGASGDAFIQDDDVSVFFRSNVYVTEGHSGTTTATFTVGLSDAYPLDISVDYATRDGLATVADNDYIPTSGTLFFPAGTTSQTFTVEVVGDTKFEPDDYFWVDLSNPVNASTFSSTVFGIIVNDDVRFFIGNVFSDEGNSGTTNFDFDVILSDVYPLDISVDYATRDNTARVSDNDYIPTSGTLFFPAGVTSQTITVEVVGDTKFESSEIFFVDLSNSVNADIVDFTGDARIFNDDVRISISNVDEFEGNSGTTNFDFDVSLIGPVPYPLDISVDFATIDVSATVADNDYIPTSGTLLFPAGTITQTITVEVIGDTIFENNEFFRVELSNPINSNLANSLANGFIRNDDAQEVDADGDGAPESVDCDDNDPNNYPGNTEFSDGQDNDCDGFVDEIFTDEQYQDALEICEAQNPGATQDQLEECAFDLAVEMATGPVCPNDCNNNGVCQEGGICECFDGWTGPLCDEPETCTPEPEICTDGIDNDCDGLVDITDPSCQFPEVCDGVDNDGDGSIDEGFVGLGEDCSAGVGACEAPGIVVCSADGVATECNAVPGPSSAEICDTIDNDCDGFVDESDDDSSLPLTVTCSLEFSGIGECTDGTQTCIDGELGACVDAVLPSPETCENTGQDNDCDGEIDNVEGLDDSCTVGIGACQAGGLFVCSETGLVCGATPSEPSNETCNDVDDDCDGVVDEDFDLGNACTVGVGACERTGVFVCGIDGGQTCSEEPGEPAEETCNGVDDNCNGEVDENETGGSVCTIPITIDIQPDTYNCNGKGVIPIVIFATATFDPLQIDLSTIVVDGAPATEKHGKLHAEDIDGDGIDDAMFHLDVAEQNLPVCDSTPLGQTFIPFSGALNDGTPVDGSDNITLKGKKIKEN